MKNVLVLAMLSGVINSSGFAQEVLFDIDFSSPHELGKHPVVDVGHRAPTKIVYGSPDVVHGYGGFDQALLLNTEDSENGYEQIKLDLSVEEGPFHFSMDVYTERLVGSDNKLSIIFDGPEMYSVNFHGMGFIDVYSADKGSKTLHVHRDGVQQHLDVEIDPEKKEWSIYIDGVLIYKSEYLAATLKSVRLNLAPWTTRAEETELSNVVIDNISLYKHTNESRWSDSSF